MKSAQFPVTGDVTASYHTVGTEIVGQATNQNEKVITIDGLLVSPVFIADIDEAMAHYSGRSIYTKQMGRKLASVYDRNSLIEVVKAARASANITGGYGGTEIASDKFKVASGGAATVDEQATAIAAAIFQAAQTLDEKDIPQEERFCALRPATYYALVQGKDAINKDWGGSGMYSDGKVWKIAGITILKSNHVPKLNTTKSTYDAAGGSTYAANPEYNAYHNADCGKTVGVVWVPAAIGTVKLMDLSIQAEWDIRRQGTLLVARYAIGHGGLRPECAVELKLSSLYNTGSTYP